MRADQPGNCCNTQSIQSYRKNIVICVNKMDVLLDAAGGDHGEEEKRKVADFVADI